MNDRFPEWKRPYFDYQGYACTPDRLRHKYGWRCFEPKNLKLGKYCDIAYGCLIQATYTVEIGEYTQVGPFCYISSWDSENDTTGAVDIGDNVMIGAHSTILPNTDIPDNTKIPAYSIVMRRHTKNMINRRISEWSDLCD